MRPWLAALALALTSTHVAAADPDPRPPRPPLERVAVVAIDLGPNVPAYLATTTRTQIEGGLVASGYDVARVAAPPAGELAACREGACVRAVGEALAVRAVVYATITIEDEHTVIAMRLVDAITGERVAEAREVCELCGEAELSNRVGVAAVSLGGRALEARERRARTLPDPAAVAGARRPAPPPGRAAPGSLVPGVAIGVAGIALLGAGVYLITLDGAGTCSPGDTPVYPSPGAVIRYPDPSRRDVYVCRDVYRTKAMGIAGVGAGALAFAAGAVLAVRARDRGRAVEVAPLPGGAAVKVSLPW